MHNNSCQLSTFFREIAPLILPQWPELAVLSCRFNVEAYQDALFTRHNVAFPDTIRGAVVKRKAEYFAGRFLCRQLLTERGLPPQVASGCHRQPLWPRGWIGSITHSDDTAIVALTQCLSGQVLGLDLESWMLPTQIAEIRDLVIAPGELDALSEGWPPERLLTLAFSAKESLFKALYPSVGEYFDFDCATLLDVDNVAGRFTIGLRRTLCNGLMTGNVFEGGWMSLPGQILTVITTD